jgi:hypothetical protein
LAYSTNGGTTFTNAPTGELSQKGVYVNGSTVFVATGFGVQASTNYFATEPTTSGVSAGLVDAYVTGVYVNGGTLYASTWGGLGISTDGGATFTNDTIKNCLGDDFVFGTFVSGGNYLCRNGWRSEHLQRTGRGLPCIWRRHRSFGRHRNLNSN